ncbi:hypothetical protein Lesp02_00400 [Lentzea sp. NBRC 105346]|uniref:hypothetical protein n=1 Tax=Lentzea sp. NBRC 105346 TaxID=3032205 RepID=UPI0024A32113|nr:hypothetical protein [Lentzea sp. NBRC 105346]GLZ27850.1 hypothetical protein Lesp02_00400 [Lentzea sp. NBRC 105346]
MKTGHKVAAYALALVIVFGGAWAAGAAVGPLGDGTPSSDPGAMAHSGEAAALPPGLSVSENGYTLQILSATPEIRFRITGPDGSPVTTFAVEHEKKLHLVLVRRDGSGYQHLHPTMAADGTWSTPLTLSAAGSYRVFTDFRAEGGPKTTLGANIQVPGLYEPRQYATDQRSSIVDGYAVTITGDLKAGAESTVTATVTKDGRPVTDLQKYLGANGHLVALRSTDLAYLHVHPQDAPGSGPEVKFVVEVPTSGTYRLFLDFQHEGKVRTADFTLATTGAATTTTKEEGHAGHGG